MFLFLLVLTVITFWLGYNAGMLQSSVAHRSYKENCDVVVSKLKEEAIKSASNNYKLKSNIEITRNNHNDECSIKGINRPCSQETLKLEFSPGTYSLNTIFDKMTSIKCWNYYRNSGNIIHRQAQKILFILVIRNLFF